MSSPKTRRKKRGRPAIKGTKRRDVQIGVRYDADTLKRIDALTKIGLLRLTRTHIVLACVRAGLDVIEADPSRLVAAGKRRT